MLAEEENGVGLGHQVEDDAHHLASVFNPDFTKIEPALYPTHLKSIHWYLTILWAAASIAFWICIGVIPQLGVDRLLPVTVSVISTPVTPTNNTFVDTFHTETIRVSGLPTTVLLATAATWQFLYHVLHSVVYKTWIRSYVHSQVNPYRWLFAAGTKTLSYIVLFALNGEHELSFFLFLASTVAGASFLAHALDESVAVACRGISHNEKNTGANRILGLTSNVVNYGRAFGLLSAVIAINFIIRLAKNHEASPRWVYALSIAILIFDFLTAVYYVYSTYQGKCNKNNQAQFVTGDWRFMECTFVSFVALSTTVFAKQATI
jgi:hypothetical protein